MYDVRQGPDFFSPQVQSIVLAPLMASSPFPTDM